MIICHCKAVNDRTIRLAVRRGASTLRQVSLACAAGRSCGGCVPAIDSILACELEQASSGDASFDRVANG